MFCGKRIEGMPGLESLDPGLQKASAQTQVSKYVQKLVPSAFVVETERWVTYIAVIG